MTEGGGLHQNPAMHVDRYHSLRAPCIHALLRASATRCVEICGLVLVLAAVGCAAPAANTEGDLEAMAVASLAQIEGEIEIAGLREEVEVLRDRWGVPHIYARNVDDLFYAQGYVAAQDRLWQLDKCLSLIHI